MLSLHLDNISVDNEVLFYPFPDSFVNKYFCAARFAIHCQRIPDRQSEFGKPYQRYGLAVMGYNL